MKICSYLIIFLLNMCSLTYAQSNSSEDIGSSKDELVEFAHANCLFMYFSKKDLYIKDMRAVSGMIADRNVDNGRYTREHIKRVSLLVSAYNPAIVTSNNYDIDLLKNLKENETFVSWIYLSYKRYGSANAVVYVRDNMKSATWELSEQTVSGYYGKSIATGRIDENGRLVGFPADGFAKARRLWVAGQLEATLNGRVVPRK